MTKSSVKQQKPTAFGLAVGRGVRVRKPPYAAGRYPINQKTLAENRKCFLVFSFKFSQSILGSLAKLFSSSSSVGR